MTKFKVFHNEDDLPAGIVAARRIDCLEYDFDSLHTIIKEQCIDKGQPLVISNMNKSDGWNSQIFTLEQLKKYRGDAGITITTKTEKTKTDNVGNYIETVQKKYNLNSQDQQASVVEELNIASQDQLNSGTNQQGESSTISNVKKYKPLQRDLEGVYAKDITCPIEYREAMNDFLPDYLLPHGNNDLFSLLPQRFQAENLMCYLGQDDTGTPIHRDLCGTMGHNIMTMASPGGYAEWIIVLNEQRDKLASYIKPSATENKITNRQDRNNKIAKSSVTKSSFMECDRAWLTRSMLGNKSLKVQVIIQKPGDLIIIPSRAYHQVRNVGVSVKIAWNRITPQTLKYAFQDQLPLYRIINRPEVYKCKAIVNFTLDKWNEYLLNANTTDEVNNNIPFLKYGRDSFIQDCDILLDLYLNNVLYPEMLLPQDEKRVRIDGPGEFCTIICDFCHGDVFYRYYHCDKCDSYDLCMNCYATGRSCQHVNDMKMMQSPVPFSTFTDLYKNFIANVNRVLNEQVFIDESENLYSRIEESPSLSTICHRIEYYRRRKGRTLNIMKCTHCSRSANVSELAEAGISLTSIFSHRLCPKAKKKTSNDLFVCKKCISKCDSCQPLIESNESITGYDLVYYAHPALDIRNWGAVFDFNMNKSCHYPIEYYDTYLDSISKASTAKGSQADDRESSVSKTKQVVKVDRGRKNISTAKNLDEIKDEEELPANTAASAPTAQVKKGRSQKTAHCNDDEIKDENLVATSITATTSEFPANNKPSAAPNTFSVKRNRKGKATYTNNQDNEVALLNSTATACSTKLAKKDRKRKMDTANGVNENKQENEALTGSTTAASPTKPAKRGRKQKTNEVNETNQKNEALPKSKTTGSSSKPAKRGRKQTITTANESNEIKQEERELPASATAIYLLDPRTSKPSDSVAATQRSIKRGRPRKIIKPVDSTPLIDEGPIATRLKSRKNNLNKSNNNEEHHSFTSRNPAINNQIQNMIASNTAAVIDSLDNDISVATSVDIINSVAAKIRCHPPRRIPSSCELRPNQGPARRQSPRSKKGAKYHNDQDIEIGGMPSTSANNIAESSHHRKQRDGSADNSKNYDSVKYDEELLTGFDAIELDQIAPKTNTNEVKESLNLATDLIQYSQKLQNGPDNNENYVIEYNGRSPTSITPYQDTTTKGSKKKNDTTHGNKTNSDKESITLSTVSTGSSVNNSKKRKNISDNNEEAQEENRAPRRLRITINNNRPTTTTTNEKLPLSPKKVILVVYDKAAENINDGRRRSTRKRVQKQMSPYYV